jgi:hypothetical protein
MKQDTEEFIAAWESRSLPALSLDINTSAVTTFSMALFGPLNVTKLASFSGINPQKLEPQKIPHPQTLKRQPQIIFFP